MGSRVNDTCYKTDLEAQDAYYSAAALAHAPATTSTLQMFAWSGSAWRVKQYSISSAGAVTLKWDAPAPALTFPACTVEDDAATQFADGMTLGWGVAAAMVAAWAVWFLRRGLRA
jgi:hypothetical protein